MATVATIMIPAPFTALAMSSVARAILTLPLRWKPKKLNWLPLRVIPVFSMLVKLVLAKRG